MMMSLSEAAKAMSGQMAGADSRFSSVSIDTRNINPGDLFVAIRGDNFDANDFVDDAARAGAVAAVVGRDLDTDLPRIVVEDTRQALGRLAAEWRNRLTIKVVGVTGSNGKTTVKEMVALVLDQIANVLYTHGNLNNEIGVPLTLLKLQDDNKFAVVEMGANHAGEIAYTSSLTAPDVAIITNAGAAHLEGFGSLRGVAQAKGELLSSLPDTGVAVLNADDKYFEFWRELVGRKRVISFGLGAGADVNASNIRLIRTKSAFENKFVLKYGSITGSVCLNLAGHHNVYNALAASAACFALGIAFKDVCAGLSRLQPVAGRMQPIAGMNGALLINDSYNANPTSFTAAINSLAQLDGRLQVILGAFAELGDSSAELHAEVGMQAKAAGVEHFYATGPDADKAVDAFGSGGYYFESQEDLIQQSKELLDRQSIVLIKGSRSQRMERVIDALKVSEPA